MNCERNHPIACLSRSDEGTTYCLWCEDIAGVEAERQEAVQCAQRLSIELRETQRQRNSCEERYLDALHRHMETLADAIRERSHLLAALRQLALAENWDVYCCWRGEDNPREIAQDALGLLQD